MTITPDEARARAADDLRSIRALQASDPFQKYWLRRLTQRRDETRDQFENGSAATISHEEREILRRLLASYNELLNMLKTDEGNILRTAGTMGAL